MFRTNINTRQETIQLIRSFFYVNHIVRLQFTYNKLQWISNSSMLSYTQSYVYVLQTHICYTQTYVYVPQACICYTQFMSRRIVFVTRRLVFFTSRLSLCPTESFLLHADLCLCPAESYLLPTEFKSVYTSNSVKVLSLFHQVSHQQEYSFHNRYIFATLEYYDP